MPTAIVSPEDIRAEVARKRVPIYKLAARIDIHPGRLGMMLGGRLPFPQAIAERLLELLERGEAK